MAKNHSGVELVGFVHMPNGGNPPKWSDGTIGWNGKEELHQEYLKQNKFNALDEYDDQLMHENLDSNQNNVDDIDKLKSEIDNFEKLSNGSFMKAEHVSNLLSKVNKKKRDIDSQIKYMKSHKMENSALYKKLEGFSEKLNSIKRKLKNIDI